ncbi:MAG: hypothetical protein RI564_09665 [Gracilimonas sp.]|nr:hypothetical protein [Gracilimonas sp.]
MRKGILCSIVLTVFFSGFIVAQSDEGVYLNIDYLKVESENINAFKKFVNDTWTPLLQDEMDQQHNTGSYFYKVVYPGGSLSKYNFVLVRNYTDLDTMMVEEENLLNLLSSNNLLKKTLELADYQYSELWRTEAGLMSLMDSDPAKFAVVNFMWVKPGMGNQYLALENDIAKPLHEERKRLNQMHNWRTYSLLKPGGINYKYNFATADFYNKVSNIEYGFTNEIMKNVMPNANFTETMDAIDNTRDIVDSELWQLLFFHEK